MLKRIVIYCAGALAAQFCITAVAQSSGIGRVFFTAQERRALEAGVGKTASEGESARESASNGNALTFNGLVKRSGGRATAWVNGAPLDLLPREKQRQYRLSGDRLLVRDAFGNSQLSAGEKRQGAKRHSKKSAKKSVSRANQDLQ